MFLLYLGILIAATLVAKDIRTIKDRLDNVERLNEIQNGLILEKVVDTE